MRIVSVLISRLPIVHFLALVPCLLRPRWPQRPNGIPPMSRILVRVADAGLRPYRRRDSAEVELGQCSGLVWTPVGEMEKLTDAAGAPAETREFMASGRKLNFSRQTDLSLPCVSSGLRCWGLLCDLDLLPHFPRRNRPPADGALFFRGEGPSGRILHT